MRVTLAGTTRGHFVCAELTPKPLPHVHSLHLQQQCKAQTNAQNAKGALDFPLNGFGASCSTI